MGTNEKFARTTQFRYVTSTGKPIAGVIGTFADGRRSIFFDKKIMEAMSTLGADTSQLLRSQSDETLVADIIRAVLRPIATIDQIL